MWGWGRFSLTGMVPAIGLFYRLLGMRYWFRPFYRLLKRLSKTVDAAYRRCYLVLFIIERNKQPDTVKQGLFLYGNVMQVGAVAFLLYRHKMQKRLGSVPESRRYRLIHFPYHIVGQSGREQAA